MMLIKITATETVEYRQEVEVTKEEYDILSSRYDTRQKQDLLDRLLDRSVVYDSYDLECDDTDIEVIEDEDEDEDEEDDTE